MGLASANTKTKRDSGHSWGQNEKTCVRRYILFSFWEVEL